MESKRIAADLLEHLPWDSDHFGFPVARWNAEDLHSSALSEALESAREAGISLVYWAAPASVRVPGRLLHEFAGAMVDEKATFTAALEQRTERAHLEGYDAHEHPRAEPCRLLVELAIVAGSFSRFRRDHRIPTHAFRKLYEEWLRRSTTGELADLVLVATPRGPAREPVGFMTVAIKGGAGSVGLIAVDPSAQGRGIGSLLLDRGHRWLLARGAPSVSVVTQLENRPACRLYEKAGYRLTDVRRVYHFWPLVGSRAGFSQAFEPAARGGGHEHAGS